MYVNYPTFAIIVLENILWIDVHVSWKLYFAIIETSLVFLCRVK